MIKKLFGVTSVLITAVLILLYIPACSGNNANAEELFRSFNFSLNFGYGGGVNCVDTYNGTFTKDLIPGTETIPFVIPEDKMREFYETFLQYNIQDLPDDISGEDRVTPAFTYVLAYTYGKNKKTVICQNVDSIRYSGAENTQKNFVAFADMIRDYIFNTDEYKNMPLPNGGYV